MAGNQLILPLLQKRTPRSLKFCERDQCQAKLNILVEGFMRDDMPTYRDALAWLRDFADQKNVERGRVMCGSYWYTPQDQQRQPTD